MKGQRARLGKTQALKAITCRTPARESGRGDRRAFERWGKEAPPPSYHGRMLLISWCMFTDFIFYLTVSFIWQVVLIDKEIKEQKIKFFIILCSLLMFSFFYFCRWAFPPNDAGSQVSCSSHWLIARHGEERDEVFRIVCNKVLIEERM